VLRIKKAKYGESMLAQLARLRKVLKEKSSVLLSVRVLTQSKGRYHVCKETWYLPFFFDPFLITVR
jgi:hypothetical protein